MGESFKYNHFIPKFIVKNFAQKGMVNIYNTRLGIFDKKRPGNIFGKDYLYWDENQEDKKQLEKDFNNFLENKLSKLIKDKFINSKKVARIDRLELHELKRFMLAQLCRIDYESIKNNELEYNEINKRLEKSFNLNRQFKEIDSETLNQKWLRELKVILHNDFMEVINDEDCSFSLWKSWRVVNDSFFGLWENKTTEDFILSDIALTSETDVTFEKQQFLNYQYNNITDDMKHKFFNDFFKLINFHENFFMFPLTPTLVVVLINPIFKQIYNGNYKAHSKEFVSHSGIHKEMFYTNKAIYKNKNVTNTLRYSNQDIFIYEKKQLVKAEVIYLNMLQLDRVQEYFGFKNFQKIKASLIQYNNLEYKRNNYSKFLK